jgi:hypothetical protein
MGVRKKAGEVVCFRFAADRGVRRLDRRPNTGAAAEDYR